MATAAPSPTTTAPVTVVPPQAPSPSASDLDKAIGETLRRQSVSWTVADTGEKLDLSIAHVRRLFASPTKSGQMPSDRECWGFLHLCKARGLNPYVGDAFLIGYDESDGTAKFSLITAHQALLKRAEASGKKKGMESGVIVIDEVSGEERERHGDFYLSEGEKLVGGWAKVFRSDWDHPAYERLSLATYNKGRGRWRIDPAGMIVKCAEASAHRLAFPKETGGMYVREELGSGETQPEIAAPPAAKPLSRVEQMAASLAPPSATPVGATSHVSTDPNFDPEPPVEQETLVPPLHEQEPENQEPPPQPADAERQQANLADVTAQWAPVIAAIDAETGTPSSVQTFREKYLSEVPEQYRSAVLQMLLARQLEITGSIIACAKIGNECPALAEAAAQRQKQLRPGRVARSKNGAD